HKFPLFFVRNIDLEKQTSQMMQNLPKTDQKGTKLQKLKKLRKCHQRKSPSAVDLEPVRKSLRAMCSGALCHSSVAPQYLCQLHPDTQQKA
ncbi:hypothetical protein Csa_017479, partial [Cucumis sativus]